MPLCFGASGSVRASTKIQLARWPADVQIFWPLMTHSSPSSTARQPRFAEVGAGVGLGVALAPEVLAREDAGQVVLLLLLGPPLQDRVADHLDAEHVVARAGGHAGPVELLDQDHLLERAQPATAVLAGPRRGQQTVLVQGDAASPGRTARPRPSAARRRPASRSAAARRGTPGSSPGRPRPRPCRWVARRPRVLRPGSREAQGRRPQADRGGADERTVGPQPGRARCDSPRA